MNYGSFEEGNGGGGGGDGRQDPLLPPRDPSTAESRRLRKRTSRKAALRAASRRQLMMLEEQQETKPVMKNLFVRGDSKKKQLQKDLQKQRKSAAMTVAPMDIETLQDLVPAGGTGSSNGGGARLSSATTKKKRSSQSQDRYQNNQNQQQSTRQQQQHKTRHSWLYVLLHPHSSHPHAVLFQQFISFIICCDVAFFVASTEVAWRTAFPQLFYIEEGIVSSIFMLELLCRLYVAPESHKYVNMSPFRARLHYMMTFAAMIDAISALPFFLELPTDWNLPNLTWIRFFRLLRILKTKSYARSMDTVWRVIYYNREILYVGVNLCLLLILVTAVLMYYLRPQDPEDAEAFSSLLATMYIATLLLTGQGGPEGDLPWYTKFVVLLTGIFSVAMFAIPASMLTWGFEAEAERCARKARQKYVSRLRTEEEEQEVFQDEDNDECSYSKYVSSSSSSEGDTTDEEYLDIIAGGEEEDDVDTGEQQPAPQDEVVKQLIRTFQTSDADASGSLSMDEFIELMTDPSVASQHLTMMGMATSMGLLAKRVHRLEHELAESHRKLDEILKAVK